MPGTHVSFRCNFNPRARRVRLLAALLVIGLLGWPERLAVGAEGKPASNGEASDGDYVVSFWRTGDGLPHHTVNALLQTRDGFLWVGTAAGLARFDGLAFTTLGDEMVAGLGDTPVTALLEDRQGRLWVGTQGKGVLRLGPGKTEQYATQQGLAGNWATSLAEDATGAIWIGTQDGLNRWQDGRLERFISAAVRQGDGIVALHAAGSGALWITTRSGLFCLRNGQATTFKSDQLPQGRNAEFIGAYEDHSGNLWAFGATFLLNVTQGRSLNSFPYFNLASSRVWTICEQSNGDFWIGTSGQGLFRYQNGRFEVVGAREGLEQCDVRALHADRWGNLWIGTAGNGLARLRTRRIKVVSAQSGLNSQNLTALAPDAVGGLWVGTADAGLWHWDGQRAEPWSGGGPMAHASQIQTLCTDAHTNLWVGTLGAGIIKISGSRQLRLTTADGLSDDLVPALAASRDASPGSVWAGTQAGFLHRIRGDHVDASAVVRGNVRSPILCVLPIAGDNVLAGSEAGILVQWDGTNLTKMAVLAELAGKPIRCLFEDRKGRLWIGSWGAGAFCRQGDTWMPLTKRQGLGSDYVGLVAQSDGGVFWFGTGDNLYKARSAEVEAWLGGTKETVACVPASAALDGLKCASGWPGIARVQNGGWWIACSAELLPLNRTENPGSEPAPPVILQQVFVNGLARTLPPAGLLKLGPGAKSLDFEFTAICFTSPQKVRFRHQLVNFDADWVEGGVARRAHYGPLPAGNYRFRVIAANAEGLWNEQGASLDLVVTPPLWRAWWFLSLSSAGLAAGIWATARFISTRRLEAKLRAAEHRHAMERERARIAQDMHDEIGSKLTRISFLSEVAQGAGGEGAAASPSVEAIASTSRELLQSLDEIVWAVNPRNDNLEQLAGYLEQHAREYFQSTSCECRIHVPTKLPGVALSAELRHNVFLAFEEALNNVLKHARAHKVNITMRVEQEFFEVRVQDDGSGFSPAAKDQPGHDGLVNMKQRLKAMRGDCEILSQPGVGTTVVLRVGLGRRLPDPK